VPVTAKEFRQIALSMPEAVESAHMNHPDFRVGGKIFATLAYPNKDWGMVALAPAEQGFFTSAEPKAFTPVKGKWGQQGATSVLLKAVKKTSLKKAVEAAWKRAQDKK